MPPKKKKPSEATSKMTVKNLDEKETPFEPVPYETLDVCTSITLLSSPEKDVVTRALWMLSKYADTKDANVDFLYKNGVVPVLLELIGYSDLTILRFTLKLLGQIVTIVSTAARELSSEQYDEEIKQINYLFMTVDDTFIKEFSAQILSRVVKDDVIASYLFRTGVVVPIFAVLKTTQDPDVQLNTLTFFNNVLEAREALYALPSIVEFSPKTILCYLKNKIPEIREVAMNIVEKLTSWKSGPMQVLLREEDVVETMLKMILDNDYKALHKKAFGIIDTCMACLETASYFVKSLEFIQFCQWVKTCPKKYILPSATIITDLTKLVELRQLLFDFSIEDAVLSFFRTNNEMVFYKTCEAVSNMTSHRYCCEKMMTPIVIQCLLSMLTRSNVPVIPYHEIALKTLYDFMKRDCRTVKLIAACEGIALLTKCWLRNKQEYTEDGFFNLMDMLYMFSAAEEFRRTVMNSMMYEMLLRTFDEASQFSPKALLVLNQYVDDAECRQYFIEFGGPPIVLNKITSTPSEKMLKDVLIFLQRMFIYKRVGMVFLWAGCLQTLQAICDEAKEAIPLIGQLITMMYDLYLPIKFHELGRLEITDHLDSRFHLVYGLCDEEFPFLEIMTKQQVCPLNTVYVVDFSANVAQLTQKPVKLPNFSATIIHSGSSLEPSIAGSAKRLRSSRSQRRSSILKSSSTPKSPKGPVQLQDSPPLNEETRECFANYLTCQVPPPINYGEISEDPYLPKYVEKLKVLMYNNKKYVMCFQHQVKLVANFVNDLLSGPDGIDDPLDSHCFEVHLATLKEKLGTNIIPVGYLRCGRSCERALLFKALAEKVGVPATLAKGQIRGQNNLVYWNEVPVVNDEPYASIDDQQKTYLAYAVVDLLHRIGELMLVGSVEANKYCGLFTDTDAANDATNAIKLDSEIDLKEFDI